MADPIQLGAQTMRRILTNRFSYLVAFVLFALALAINGLAGGSWLAVVPGTLAFGSDVSELQAHGPTLPPDPWETEPSSLTAHGPTLPPDPWETEPSSLTAHGPTLPPDPWETEPSSLTVQGSVPARVPRETEASSLTVQGLSPPRDPMANAPSR